MSAQLCPYVAPPMRPAPPTSAMTQTTQTTSNFTRRQNVHHPLQSPYVRDQLSLRTRSLNGAKANPRGEYILYWMLSVLRLEENWSLRAAIVEGNRLGRAGVVAARGARLAALAACAVVAVESSCIVAAHFPNSEYARRTFRPKVMALLDNALEPVADAAPKHAARSALMASLHAALHRPHDRSTPAKQVLRSGTRRTRSCARRARYPSRCESCGERASSP